MMHQKKYPSAERLSELLDISPEEAEQARQIMAGNVEVEGLLARLILTCKWIQACFHRPAPHEIAMTALDELIDGSAGVELLTHEDSVTGQISYLNFGDIYLPTLGYFHRLGRFRLMPNGWGSYVKATT